MTAATLSRLPISAGGAAAASLARGGYWVLNRLIDFGYLAVGQFMRAPVAISTVAAIAGLSLLAGGNALYFQTARHPAPLFFEPARHVAPEPAVKPVIPAVRHPQAAIDDETTGSVGPSSANEAINNADVMALQRKLAELKLFDGTADGIFGRRTATAIKAFEIRAGLKPRGKLTTDLLADVLAASVPVAAAQATRTAAADIAPAAVPKPVLAKAAATAAGAGVPVPLAPLPRAVSVVRVADTAPPAASDTFAANSLQADDTAPAQAVAALQPSAAPSQPISPVATPAANGSAVDSSVVAMNNRPANKTTLAVAGTAPTLAPTTPPAATTTQVANLQPAPVTAAPSQANAIAAATAPAAVDNTALTPAQRLAAQMGTLPPGATPGGADMSVASANTDASSDPGDGAGSTDPALITKIQRGLASLGFLAQKIDGVPGEGTAKAIRNFEVFYDYKVTGLATPQLVNLLVQHGAQI